MPFRNIRRSLLCLVPAAALLLATTAPARADDDGGDARSMRFIAGLVISETITGADGNCMAISSLSGSGQAAQLGRVSFSAHDCINFSPTGASTFQTYQGTNAVLTSSSGDQLFATYKGTATPQPGGALLLSGTFSFKGGTGRFAGATGTGTLNGLEDTSTMPANGVLWLSGRLAF